MDILIDNNNNRNINSNYMNNYLSSRGAAGVLQDTGTGQYGVTNSNSSNNNNHNNSGGNGSVDSFYNIPLEDSLATSDYWQQQVLLSQISRRCNMPHFYAKAYAKALRLGGVKPSMNGNDFDLSAGSTLVDATTEVIQQQIGKDRSGENDSGEGSNSTSSNNGGSGGALGHAQGGSQSISLGNRKMDDSTKIDFKLNDEEFLKEQETYRRYKYLEITKTKQNWSSIDFSSQGLFNISVKLFDRYGFLTKLYLNNNNITALPKEIKKLKFLRVLDVSNNKLTQLPTEMNQLHFLKYLYLFDNQITDIPYEFGNLCELIFLGIEGNPFNQTFAKIIAERGCKNFIGYLRDNKPKKQLKNSLEIRNWITINNDGELSEQKEMKFNEDSDKYAFTVLTYNTLCHHYATKKLYGYTQSWALDWDYRRKKIIQDVLTGNCDIVCLQEVETQSFDEDWFNLMKEHGYRGVFYNKGRARRGMDSKKVDGCAIFYKYSKFTLVDKTFLEYSSVLLGSDRFKKTGDVFNRFTNKDNIAVVCYLEHIESKKRVLVTNTHLHWDPAFNDVKTLQVAVLLEELHTLSKNYYHKNHSHSQNKDKEIPIIICGDFNSQIQSAVYELLSTGQCKSHPDFKDVDYGKYTEEGFSQPFQFRSAYSNIGELPFTNFTPTFTEVIDYIWYTSTSLDIKGLLGKIDPSYLENLIGFPDENHPSDHIPLIAELKFKNNSNNKNRSRKI